MSEPIWPDWDLTEKQIQAVLLFPYCNKPAIKRGEAKTEVPWPWLNGRKDQP